MVSWRFPLVCSVSGDCSKWYPLIRDRSQVVSLGYRVAICPLQYLDHLSVTGVSLTYIAETAQRVEGYGRALLSIRSGGGGTQKSDRLNGEGSGMGRGGRRKASNGGGRG